MFLRRRPSIAPEEAARRLAADELVLVDVRESAELRGGRVRGAINIPLRELAARVGELDGGRPVAFLCRSGARSSSATRIAAKAGVDAVNVRGGVLAWTRAGLPMSR
jgi:rhodanese-related sulfurtransferase